eukprot:scaffold304903_cov40-Tisochrysis_lutea.AAC.1
MPVSLVGLARRWVGTCRQLAQHPTWLRGKASAEHCSAVDPENCTSGPADHRRFAPSGQMRRALPLA